LKAIRYEQRVPKFLRRYQNEVAGRPNTPSDDGGEEGGVDEFGREIRRRSPPREVVEENDGYGRLEEDGEEREDEAPQVVVLKEGKHLTADEAENERRIGEHLHRNANF